MATLSLVAQQFLLVFLLAIGLNALAFIYWNFFRTKRIMCRIFREYGDSFEVVKRKRVKVTDIMFKWKGKSYLIDLKNAVFKIRRGLELNY